MGGINVGVSNWGKFRGSPETIIPKSQAAPESGSINTAPTQSPSMPATPPISRMGGINVGKGSQMHTLPSSMPGDAFRTYATVNGGRITPPQNMYAPPSNLPTGGGAGTWEGGGPGPINSGPTNPLQYMQGGGFTGGQMPPQIQSGSAAASMMPQTLPNMPSMRRRMGMGNPNPSAIPNMQSQNPMARRGFRGAYGGGDESSMNSPFKSNLFY